MTKQEVFDLMQDWEYDAGESIIDGRFGTEIKAGSFMCWCLGRGHITKEQFNEWEICKDPLSSDPNYFLVGGRSYSVTDDENWERGYMILSEFISESVTYQNKLKKFLEEN